MMAHLSGMQWIDSNKRPNGSNICLKFDGDYIWLYNIKSVKEAYEAAEKTLEIEGFDLVWDNWRHLNSRVDRIKIEKHIDKVDNTVLMEHLAKMRDLVK